MNIQKYRVNGRSVEVVLDLPTDDEIKYVIALAAQSGEIRTGNEGPMFWGELTLGRWRDSDLGVLIVARINDHVVGFGLASYNPLTHDGYLNALVIDPGNRLQGIAGTILAEIERMLIARGCNHIFALVKPSNRATLALVDSLGYSQGYRFIYCEKHIPDLRRHI